jgi:hypothetical protein
MPAIGLLNVLVVAIAASILVPQFMVMFQGFGAELPTITHLMLDTYRWWAVLALAVPMVWASWPNRRTRGVTGLIVGSVIALLLAAFCVWACYAPIFALAAVVA